MRKTPCATSLAFNLTTSLFTSIWWKRFCTHSKGTTSCWTYYQKHHSFGEQDYLCMYSIIQQVTVRVTKALCHGLINCITWNIVYNYSEKYVSIRVVFIWYNSRLVHLWAGLWIINIHRTYKFPLGVFQPMVWLNCILVFLCLPASTLPLGSVSPPLNANMGGEWFYYVPPLFLAHSLQDGETLLHLYDNLWKCLAVYLPYFAN